MKRQFVTMGILAAALLSATAFADDAQMQMNNQTGQMQTTMPSTTTTVTPSTTTVTPSTTTIQPAMPSTAIPQTVTPDQTVNPVPQTGAMPDAATGSPDDMNTPTPNY